MVTYMAAPPPGGSVAEGGVRGRKSTPMSNNRDVLSDREDILPRRRHAVALATQKRSPPSPSMTERVATFENAPDVLLRKRATSVRPDNQVQHQVPATFRPDDGGQAETTSAEARTRCRTARSTLTHFRTAQWTWCFAHRCGRLGTSKPGGRR